MTSLVRMETTVIGGVTMRSESMLESSLPQSQSIVGALRGVGGIFLGLGILSGLLMVASAFNANGLPVVMGLYIALEVGSIVMGVFFWAFCNAVAHLIELARYSTYLIEQQHLYGSEEDAGPQPLSRVRREVRR